MKFYEALSYILLILVAAYAITGMIYIQEILINNLEWYYLASLVFLVVLYFICSVIYHYKMDDWMFDESEIYSDETNDV